MDWMVSAGGRRSFRARRYPRSARTSATRRPIPWAAPVIAATGFTWVKSTSNFGVQSIRAEVLVQCVPSAATCSRNDFLTRGGALPTGRIPTLFALGVSLVPFGFAAGQTASPTPAAVPVQATARPNLPEPHVNTPLRDIIRMPGDGDGAYKTHEYRDLFAELGHSRAESHAKIEKAFHQLFHGDGQEERLYFETGANANGPLAYVTDWANNDARSEGMSYGMMIAVQLDKKREFDALWNWSKTYMLTTDPENPSLGYFAWSMGTDGSARAVGAAPDGEEYYAMALYFAAHRWGNGQGIYNYQAEADKILSGMRHHPTVTATTPFRIHPGDAPFIEPDTPWPGPNNRRAEAEALKAGKPWPPYRPMRTPRSVTVGPMVDEAHTMIRFVPETSIPGTDASYHLPAFYELWARWGPVEDRAFWTRAADVSRNFF